MSETVKIISPVDGSVYAERPIASDAEVNAALSAARTALPKWRAVSIPERARYMLAFLDALLAMNDDIAVELAWQMGRPVRYGGEKGGVEERIRAMAAHGRGGAQALLPAGESRLPPLHRPRAARHRDGDRAVELPVSHRDQHHRARPARRQRHHLEARRADAARRRAHRRGVPARRPAEGSVSQSRPIARADREAARLGPDRPHQFHRLGRRGPRHRARRCRHLRVARARARRQGPGLCPRRRQARSRDRESGRRCLLQFRPMLLRGGAHLCRCRRLRRLRRWLRRSHPQICRRQSARRRDHAWADGARLLRRHGAGTDRGGTAQGRQGAHQHEGDERPRRLALSRAGGADQRQSPDGGDAGRELRARGRHHEGARRRGGDSR